MAEYTPKIEILSQKEMLIFKPRGFWVAKTGIEAEPLCQDILQKTLPHHLIFDLAALGGFDTVGVWLLQRTIHTLEQKGHCVEVQMEATFFLISLRE